MTDAAPKKYAVGLTAKELLLLDGQCSAEVQQIIDQAKSELAFQAQASSLDEPYALCVGEILASVEKLLGLTLKPNRIGGSYRCACCKQSPGYFPYTRNGSRARKGKPNYDRPRTWHGTSFNDMALCPECAKIVRAALVEMTPGMQAEIPEQISGHKPAFTRHEKAWCADCGWEGHEGQMRRMRPLMGEGTYPGGCPSCPATNRAFGITQPLNFISSAHVLVDEASGMIVAEYDGRSDSWRERDEQKMDKAKVERERKARIAAEQAAREQAEEQTKGE